LFQDGSHSAVDNDEDVAVMMDLQPKMPDLRRIAMNFGAGRLKSFMGIVRAASAIRRKHVHRMAREAFYPA